MIIIVMMIMIIIMIIVIIKARGSSSPAARARRAGPAARPCPPPATRPEPRSRASPMSDYIRLHYIALHYIALCYYIIIPQPPPLTPLPVPVGLVSVGAPLGVAASTPPPLAGSARGAVPQTRRAENWTASTPPPTRFGGGSCATVHGTRLVAEIRTVCTRSLADRDEPSVRAL